MVGFRRIKTKWIVTPAMVLAVALAFGIWLHHWAAVGEAAKAKTADAAAAGMSEQFSTSPYATAADFAKYAMKLRERQANGGNFLPTPTPDFRIGKGLSLEQQLKAREQEKARELKKQQSAN